MSSKEDILEQLVEEYLTHRGYFVQHNVKFLPRKDHPDFVPSKDSNHSDIDVLAFHPNLIGPDRVWAVSCKSWQDGFDPTAKIKQIDNGQRANGREAWKGFRELVVPKWSEAFMDAVLKASGQTEFTYVTAVTKLIGTRDVWEGHGPFRARLKNNPIRVVTLSEMLAEVSGVLTTTLAGTELGRTLQLFRAAGVKV